MTGVLVVVAPLVLQLHKMGILNTVFHTIHGFCEGFLQ